MIFKNKQKSLNNDTLPQIKINNKLIDKVSNIRYLGIYLDEDLSWTTHTNYTATKISKTIGILNRLRNTLPENILKTIYNSLINPYLHYCILSWGPNNESQTDRLFKLQKKAVRLITCSRFYAHTENLFKKLKILKIQDIFVLQQLKFYQKFIKNELPNCLTNFLTLQNPNVRACHTAFFLKLQKE